MVYYKLVVAYDGTDFCGWAPQPGLPSVTQTLQDIFYDIFHKKIVVVGASRTDAGVHALGQVVRFGLESAFDPHILHRAWSARLPRTIMLRSLDYAPEGFHPHHDIAYKTYYYHFFRTRPLPFIYRYGVYYPGAFDRDRLSETLQVFVGVHDFTAFSTGEPIGNNPMCTIDAINVWYLKRFGVYRISITGNRFLRHMVRRLVGAAFMGAQKKDILSATTVKHLLQTQNKLSWLPTAPAEGLLLYKIQYK